MAEPATSSTAADERRKLTLEWIKAIGTPVATVLITLVGGHYFTNLVNEREARESNERLYAQLLTQREQSDASIRKDMFGVVINRFLAEANQADLDTKILQLELLASNFNQSLDLAPLFKDLARRLTTTKGLAHDTAAALRARLDLTAANLVFKQVSSLARRGYTDAAVVPLADWEKSIGTPFIDRVVPRNRVVESAPASAEPLRFSLEIVDVSFERHEVEVRMRVNFGGNGEHDIDRHFWVGQYDFPMLDNTQLPLGLRASVVISEFYEPEGADAERAADTFVKMHLVVFPAASASFKERQDYDDILSDMLRQRANAASAAP